MQYKKNKNTNEYVKGEFGLNINQSEWESLTEDQYSMGKKAQSLHLSRKFLRDSEKFAPTIESQGHTLKTDIDSMNALSFASGRFNGNTSIDWFDANDNAITLSKTEVIHVIDDVYTRGLNATVKSKTLKAAINALDNVADLEAFDVEAEWNKL